MKKFAKASLAIIGYLAFIVGLFFLNVLASGIEQAFAAIGLFLILTALFGVLAYKWHQQGNSALAKTSK